MSYVTRSLLIAWLLLPAAAFAQDANLDAAARRLFDEGVTLLEDGRASEALERLERARAIREVPAIVYNLALAQRTVGRYVAAASSLERYAALAGDRLPAARRAECDRILGELRAAVARVTLRVDPPNAQVTIDGAPYAGPGELSLDPGTHRFRATVPGYDAVEVTEELSRGARLAVTLALRATRAPQATPPNATPETTPETIPAPTPSPSTGTLSITTPSEDCVVFVDGRRIGRGSLQETLSAGRHELELRAPGWRSWRDTVEVRAGRVERLAPSMTRESGGIFSRWWFWTGVGLLAAGATTALVLTLSGTEEPYRGTLNQVVQAYGQP